MPHKGIAVSCTIARMITFSGSGYITSFINHLDDGALSHHHVPLWAGAWAKTPEGIVVPLWPKELGQTSVLAMAVWIYTIASFAATSITLRRFHQHQIGILAATYNATI